jgi:hypothetical protein
VIISTKERRAFQRMIINAPITLYQGDAVLMGICRDLSATGMGILVNEHSLDLGLPIRVSLATHSNLLPPFEVQAHILRELDAEEGTLLAVAFLPIS